MLSSGSDSSGEPPALAIKLFGPMEVRVGGEPLPRLRSRKSLWLLALLTLRHDRRVERSWLAGTLWPEALQHQALSNLAAVLSDLRKALGEQKTRLQAPTHRTLLLDLSESSASVDVVVFDSAIKSGDPSALQRAVEVYSGALLEGCPEEWVPQERWEREQSCLNALRTLAENASLSHDYEAAYAFWQHALKIDPRWDRARRGAMEALAARGDRNAALQVYREFANLLNNGPNAAPDKETTELYRRLRAEAATPSSGTEKPTTTRPSGSHSKGYLPHAITRLVGREDERLEVADKLRQSRLVTLAGPGGIGKTRLALEVASGIAGRYPDGVWFIALESLSPGSDSTIVWRHVAVRLGLKEVPEHTCLSIVTDHLRTKNLLLVVDNCEHLLKASAEVIAHLLRECAQVRVIATSREALRITGEIAWIVPALAVPDTAHLPQSPISLARILTSFDSVQLFAERAQAVQQSFALTGSNALLVTQVCVRLEGIPLAIELAAARIKAMTLEQIVTRLQDHFGQLHLLRGGSRVALSRQQTMRATLDWSYALLTEQERLLLGRLSVFTGGWRLSAAEQVCADDSLPTEQILNSLESLVEKSLVRFESVAAREHSTGGESGRYHLLEVVRQYAAEQLGDSDASAAVRARHRDWCLIFAETAAEEWQTAPQEEILRQVEAEYGNLRSVLVWCDTEPPGGQIGLRLTAALLRFWHIRAYYREGREFLERALARAGSAAEPLLRAKALAALGGLAYALNDYDASQAAYEENLTFFRERGDARGIVSSLAGLAYLARGRGDYPKARRLLEESLSRYRELGDKVGMGQALINLGGVLVIQGDHSSAQALFEESRELFREIGDRRNLAWAVSQLGTIASSQGNYVTARVRYEECLAIFEELKDRRGIAMANSRIGNLEGLQGHYELAQAHIKMSIDTYREIGDQGSLAWALTSLSKIHTYQGDNTLARSVGEEALHLLEGIGDKRGRAVAMLNLGLVASRDDDLGVARTWYAKSLTLSRELQELGLVASNLEKMAALLRVLPPSDPVVSVRLWGAAHALREQIGAPLPANERNVYERERNQVRMVLGEDTFAVAWEQGWGMTWEKAAAYALAEADTIS